MVSQTVDGSLITKWTLSNTITFAQHNSSLSLGMDRIGWLFFLRQSTSILRTLRLSTSLSCIIDTTSATKPEKGERGGEGAGSHPL